MRKKNFTRTVGVLLAEDTYQQLVDITDEYEVTISEYIRDLGREKIKYSKGENVND